MGDNAWQKVTRKKSMEDLTQRISKSVFITNFLDHFSARDLWMVCKGYGTVVDVYIPNRKSKAGKRYAFVSFIRVDNIERLVSNLCTVWSGRLHMHANVVRFDRPAKPTNRPIRTETPAVTTYAYVHKDIKPNHTPVVSIPSMVLDDSHIVHRDLSFHVMGEAKQFMSIQKLPTILSKEGFSNVKLTYLGGLWVMMEFSSLITKEKFLHHVGVASWFNILSNAQPDFIGSKWGELLEMEELKDDLFARKRLCIKTKQEDNILEKFKILIRGKAFVIRAKELFAWVPLFQEDKGSKIYSDDESVRDDLIKENHLEPNTHDMDDDTDDDGVSDTYFGHDDKDEHQQQSNQMNQASEDPFQIYDLLKKQDNEAKKESEKTYPPGFTPDAKDNKKVEDKVSSPSVGFNSRIMADSPPIEDHISSLRSKAKKDWVKELNVLHKVNFLALQETKMENFSVMEAKYIWGNSNFAYLSSDSIDNFIAVYGTWMPTKSKILIIAIYAPQSVIEKHTLWQYITHLIHHWNGECIVMGDFNEVGSKDKR
ncbi:RNA-directed DNA polymerase, eukaryota [Tanacetum coccineum]